MAKYPRKFRKFLLLLLCTLVFVIGTTTVYATTYFVATSGNDSNPGTSGAPFLTIQKCVDTVVAGDTCTVANGTYRDTDGNGIVVYARSSSGTASAPITIKSTNPWGAVIVLPGIDSINAGFYIGQSYYIIEGFDITGGTGTGLNASNTAIVFGGTGNIARKNKIHHIGRSVCSNSAFSASGIFLTGANSVTIDQNQIYSVGRLKNGENGCSTTIYHHDHGIYIKGGSNVVISRNVLYDDNRGWPIHVFGSTVNQLFIFNNTLSDNNSTTLISGQILLCSTITNAIIRNNISYKATTGMINYYSLTATNVVVDHNLSDTAVATGSYSGVSIGSNLTGISPGFMDTATRNYQLTVGSAAVDAGMNVGLWFTGSAPDIGALELGEGTTSPAPSPPRNLTVR